MNDLHIQESEDIVNDIINLDLSMASRKYLLVAATKLQGLEDLSKAIMAYNNPDTLELAKLRAHDRVLQSQIKSAE